ncbi:helix-turn-helix domain-containing protein [Kitasatospora sp. NPDC008050]|uniref:helix-turn-helix domain-containing protein n=1 Tax=Kitasatospora sp. NPDC008050 TaxID=3364021 RepID=UPI0036EF528C
MVQEVFRRQLRPHHELFLHATCRTGPQGVINSMTWNPRNTRVDGALVWTDTTVAVRAGSRPAPEPAPTDTTDGADPCASPGQAELTDAERELGLALYRLRAERGLSLRALAKLMGYSAHSVFADVEKARRLPSESLIRCYEERFEVPPNSLTALRRRALRERAVRLTARFAADSAGSSPSPSRSASSVEAAPAPAAPQGRSPIIGRRFGIVVHGLLGHLIRPGRCLAHTLRTGGSWPRRHR